MTNRYDRQLKIKQIGTSGQKKFEGSHVLVIGVGGLGSFVSSELVKAGIGEITLLDFDDVELTNLHRQNLYVESDVGTDKLEAIKNHLQQANSNVKINTINKKYSADILSTKYDLVIDCTDNFPVKYQINEDCQKAGIKHIFGTCAANQGQVMFIDQDSACLECLYPKENIAELGLSKNIGTNPMIVAITGSLQASMAFKYLIDPQKISAGTLIVVDNWNFDFRKIHIKKRQNCLGGN
ncbi:HesA/MoeB/ThiF family protein [Companilactobacillus keshanensis]|uniref:HesA/MoeB/ThiF family protein n=1 Tax=Companilactobacillus keshanensis TaxID=2486003 RepID=A0ABW4BTJ1_9LACO|nr:HesA/MoeB/ThiF family protein [Companilactobacillus keshanensis]